MLFFVLQCNLCLLSPSPSTSSSAFQFVIGNAHGVNILQMSIALKCMSIAFKKCL